MKEMHGGSSRDDRQKREQQRQEREIAKFAQMYLFSCVQIYFYSLIAQFLLATCGVVGHGILWVLIDCLLPLSSWFPLCQSVLMLKSSNGFNCCKSLDQNQFPLKLELLLHLQIRSSEMLWSSGFLLKEVLPRYVYMLSREFGMLTATLVNFIVWVLDLNSFNSTNLFNVAFALLLSPGLCLNFYMLAQIFVFSNFLQNVIGPKRQMVAKKQNIPVSSIFNNDSDEE